MDPDLVKATMPRRVRMTDNDKYEHKALAVGWTYKQEEPIEAEEKETDDDRTDS